MNFRVIARVQALVSAIVSLCMAPAALWAWSDGTGDFGALIWSCLAGLAVSLALLGLSLWPGEDRQQRSLEGREAFAVVTFAWILASALGGLPYLISGVLPSWSDCFFEALSGFSTTGATAIADLEGLPRGILFWRALTIWIGGMGIVVLGLAVLPLMGVGAMALFKAEVPTPMPEKLTPRVHQTAMLLWLIYLFLTVLETALLMLCGLDFFDALTHSFSTLATGGFSGYSASVAHFQSPAVEWVIALFMFLSGANFTLHYLFLRGDWKAPWRDEEFRFYFRTLAVSTAAIALFLWASGWGGPGKILRDAAFQVVSMATTTGFVSADYELWPPFCQLLLILLMFAGGCGGSTGGGLKHLRVLILLKRVRLEVLHMVQPRRILRMRLNGKELKEDIVSSVTVFFIVYIFALALFTLAMTALGLDLLPSFSSVVTCLSNVGPILSLEEAPKNFAPVPVLGKWILSFCMLLGRLELMTVVVLFLPSAWR